MSEPLRHEDFLRLIEALTNEQKKHFREVLETLVQCYGDNPTMQALVLYKPAGERTSSSVISANCNDMDATEMLLATTAYFEFVTTIDAPPKEQLN